jgi:hypothetical protein
LKSFTLATIQRRGLIETHPVQPRQLYQVPQTSIARTTEGLTGKTQAYARGALRQAPPNTPRAPNRTVVESSATARIGILGSAALLQPELLPVAAAAGIGYGIYKLGESFNFW